MSDERPTNSRQHFPHGFDPNAKLDLDWLAHFTPWATTEIAEIEHAHMVGIDPRDQELLWCVHATDGRKQVLSAPGSFFTDEDGEHVPEDRAVARIVAVASRMARAPWN